MPRELKKLPRWGYSSLTNAPTWNGKPKSEKVWSDNKLGMAPRQDGNLDYKLTGRRQPPPVWRPNFGGRKADIIRYDVSCTICLDAGCDKCPVVEE